MMNAEVSAEKRPACSSTQYMCTQAPSMTYKYQGRVQILVAFLYELLIVLICFSFVMFVELSAKFCLV